MLKGRIIFTASVVLTLAGCFSLEKAQAQSHFNLNTISPSDIYNQDVGPSTTSLVMVGYSETQEYHNKRFVSVTQGSDTIGDGSESRPWASIQHALNEIQDARLSNRYALLVSAGRYSGSTIKMKEFVHVYGGFDATNWNRDIFNNLSIVDGEGVRRAFLCADESKIDGFTIENGTVRDKGGAIFCDGTSPIISNNTFKNNQTLQPDSWAPEFIHEVANDGGAIMAINGASPHITHNLFVENFTETGRGGGVAAHNRAAPLIAYNVFLNNNTGIKDPMRSSDGGAISAVSYSPAEIYYNVIVGNRADGTNDGGGIFIEHWSSAHIGGNIVLANASTDDGGGIYLAGQLHHYITNKETIPSRERFLINVVGNTIIANTNRSAGFDSGFRFTLDSQLNFDRNVTFGNKEGVDFRQSIISANDNIFFDNVTLRESDHPATFNRNLILGEFHNSIEAEIIDMEIINSRPLVDSRAFGRIFKSDGAKLEVIGSTYNSSLSVTTLTIMSGQKLLQENLNNRVVSLGDKWSTIRANDDLSITVWGNHEGVESLDVLPTLTRKREN